ncbi:hypothetical protein FEM03_00305 [Phragmitibacter flavus]|uniref:Uncharacterized protein n=1 Tax=Phragmitibacter flavus TaxID=2576071 RepID=A0A5R8KJT5_9BACT|nr:hypothetical protein [Phragmitibacter flavus]TLD72552.1 hypothetical protein FEM03_00305 [Phragmitibacter flavus]
MVSTAFILISVVILFMQVPTMMNVVMRAEPSPTIIFAFLGLMMVGVPLWVGFGLLRLSRDARVVALCFCWLMFLSAPLGILAGISQWPIASIVAGILQLIAFFWIYRVLVSSKNLFYAPVPLTHPETRKS